MLALDVNAKVVAGREELAALVALVLGGGACNLVLLECDREIN